MRTCVGCRATLEQSAMIRCALSDEGVAIVSRTAPGRGAWLCSPTCLPAAVKRKGFERAWRRPIGRGALAGLETQLAGGAGIAFESTPTQMREWTAAGSASDSPTPMKG